MAADKDKEGEINTALVPIDADTKSLVKRSVADLTGTVLAQESTPERTALAPYPRLSETFGQMVPVTRNEAWLALNLPKSRWLSKVLGISATIVGLAELVPSLVTASSQLIIDLLDALMMAEGGAIPVLTIFAISRINFYKIFREFEHKVARWRSGHSSPEEQAAIDSIMECLRHLQGLTEQAQLLVQGFDDDELTEDAKAKSKMIEKAHNVLSPMVARAMAIMEIQMQQGKSPEFDLGYELDALREISALEPTMELTEYVATIEGLLEVAQENRKAVVSLLEEGADPDESSS